MLYARTRGFYYVQVSVGTSVTGVFGRPLACICASYIYTATPLYYAAQGHSHAFTRLAQPPKRSPQSELKIVLFFNFLLVCGRWRGGGGVNLCYNGVGDVFDHDI